MTDRLLAVFALAVLAVFLGILWWEVPLLNLGAVVLVTLALAAYDVFDTHRNRRR
jgi:Flp pilus assembly protein TadB